MHVNEPVLFVNPEDKDALQTRLFLLLQTEQYDKALSIIGNVNNEKSNCNFEKAYALYRLHNEAEAAAVLAQIKDSQRDHRGVLHLEAQLVCTQPMFSDSPILTFHRTIVRVYINRVSICITSYWRPLTLWVHYLLAYQMPALTLHFCSNRKNTRTFSQTLLPHRSISTSSPRVFCMLSMYYHPLLYPRSRLYHHPLPIPHRFCWSRMLRRIYSPRRRPPQARSKR